MHDRGSRAKGVTVNDTGFLGRLGARLTETLETSDAEELESFSRTQGADPVSSCCCGQPVTVVGRVRSLTYGLSDDELGVTAEVFDGTAAVDVVWLGRRSIPGIEVGRCLQVSGRIAVHGGKRLIYNPRYELREDTIIRPREGHRR